ncbi:unnamed protein product [Aspergillus oryzae]|nr:unnamed protein product [Aspergillus oryzae]GMG12834.1 unnamed protein product [Aspergillus oryzae]GMG35370.1 unnamed protein product [Aspergillus oryzae]GMG53014.1 unnamed protein product [Aspergillus oryzae var. brunneus]
MAVTLDITDQPRPTSITLENSGNARHEISNGNCQCQDSNSSSDFRGKIPRASVGDGVHKSQNEPNMTMPSNNQSAVAKSSNSNTSGEPGKFKKMG